MIELINQGVYLLNGTEIRTNAQGMPALMKPAKTPLLTRFCVSTMSMVQKVKKCASASTP